MAVSTLWLSTAAAAQSYPVKSGRIFVPAAPGGGPDTQARLLGRKFQESMAQAFLVENRPGAASMLCTETHIKMSFAHPTGLK